MSCHKVVGMAPGTAGDLILSLNFLATAGFASSSTKASTGGFARGLAFPSSCLMSVIMATTLL